MIPPPTDTRPSWARRHPIWTGALVLVGALGMIVSLVLLTPIFDRGIASAPAPAANYAEAMQRAQQLTGADTAEVNPVCRSRVLEPGEPVAQAVVLLHGYTNCPQQFSVIAEAYRAAGSAVVVARLPEHGYADRMTRALSEILPGDLVETADLAVDIATGLGERVTVVGMSGGGTLAAWMASQRNDVAEVVLMAPLVVPKAVPDLLAAPLVRATRFLPDVYLWWDGDKKEELDTPPYAYPRYSLRSLGAFLAVGRGAQGEPARSSQLERLVVVTNENDAAVSNAAADRVADELAVVADERIDHVFTAEEGYEHDIVDPEGENAAVLTEIYEVLGPLLGLPDLASRLQSEAR